MAGAKARPPLYRFCGPAKAVPLLQSQNGAPEPKLALIFIGVEFNAPHEPTPKHTCYSPLKNLPYQEVEVNVTMLNKYVFA
jgi:hypothetical protein